DVAVIGLAKSGRAAALLLARHGCRVYASDAGDNPAVQDAARTLRSAGVAVDVGSHDLARNARAAMVVVSPGVPPTAPPLLAARAGGAAIVSEIEVALRALPALRTIAITGTNGKTTTTALAAHLLRALGHDAVEAGNIGLPLAEVALRAQPPRWCALEISSFQLHDTPGINPTVGVVTNLSPDHLDRYASIEAYYADKALLYRNAHPGSRWVINGDQAETRALPAQRPGAQVSREPLLGTIWRFQIATALQSFTALKHRLETVAEVDGVVWINDSKATNVSSTLVAVQGMTRPTVVLLGGRHKGEPYTALIEPLKAHARLVIAYGEAAPLIARDLAGHVPLERMGSSFEDVMTRARAAAEPGDVVLLSPACSSFDMFPNYEVRGATFAALARGAA
ncbi:MAG: UDP-N-acetylmuramoyl-L-alanine--D-glutamate ligase, partial [Gemmatimonadetes bacterium]|nr:UDP-N-acetylmuramoyl-L-alanine--D-glutamate ligase [Gemmatimonadota bacterium]